MYDSAHEKTGRWDASESDGQPEEKSPVHYEEFSWNVYDFPKPKKTGDLKMEWPKEPERSRRRIDLDEPISFDIDVFRKRNGIDGAQEEVEEQALVENPWSSAKAESGPSSLQQKSDALPTEDMWKGYSADDAQAVASAAESLRSQSEQINTRAGFGGEGQGQKRPMGQAKTSPALSNVEAAEEARRESLKKADPFFDFTQTNIVFQNMLDQEYEKLQNRKRGVPYVESQWDFGTSEAAGSQAKKTKETPAEKTSAKKASPETTPEQKKRQEEKAKTAPEIPLSPEDALEQMILSGTRAVDSEKEATIQVDLDAIKRAAERRYGYEVEVHAAEERQLEPLEAQGSQQNEEPQKKSGAEGEPALTEAADAQSIPTEEKQTEAAKQQGFRKRRTMTEMEQAREEYFRMLDQEMNGLQVKVEVNARQGKVVTDVDIKSKESGGWFRRKHKAPVYEEETAEPGTETVNSGQSDEALQESAGFQQTASGQPVSFFESETFAGQKTAGSGTNPQWNSEEAATFARWQKALGEEGAGALKNAELEADRAAASKVEEVKTELQNEPPAADWLLSTDRDNAAGAGCATAGIKEPATDESGSTQLEEKSVSDDEQARQQNPAGAADGEEDIQAQQIENAETSWAYEADYDGEDEEEKSGTGSTAIKIVLGLVACIVLLEAAALGIVYIAPDSTAAQTVYRMQDKVVGLLFHSGGQQGGQNEQNGEGDGAQSQQDGQADDTDVEGSNAGQSDAALQTPDPLPMADKTALIATQLDKNKNIESITANPQLSYVAGTDYGVADINNSRPIENNIWYQNEDGTTVYYDREIVGTLIAFNSQWVDYVNGVSKEAVALTKEGSQAYINATGFSKIGKVTEKFISMEIGDIRQGENGFYLWAAEEIEMTENAASSTANYRWIYCFEPVGKEMKIVNYIRIS